MNDPIKNVRPLGFTWETADPFLFCVHHDDRYPAGNEHFGPSTSLAGRNLGMDFEVKDGWRMYHGQAVPGFPQHPHRGFETVTIVRKGFIDHSDSLGAAARFGEGDVQWLTAGKGIVHSEMFPLLDQKNGNPLELFQIWLNLPAVDKMVDPHFTMLWNRDLPRHVTDDAAGKKTSVTIVAGTLGSSKAPQPPPKSWAARAEADAAIWLITLEPGATWKLPAAAKGTNRTLNFFRGTTITVAGHSMPVAHAVDLVPDVDVTLTAAKDSAGELLLLQGKPIGEPVVQHGPFVMNTRNEIVQAFTDYQHTRFGGWPWPSDEPVHTDHTGRFARHADGRVEDLDGKKKG